MKTISGLNFLTILLSLLAYSFSCQAQQTKQEKEAAQKESVAAMVKNREYVCAVNTANPNGGKLIQLTPGYSIKIAGDSLICNLPYYGRAYSVSSTTGNGYNFNSTFFDYVLTERKKGGWDIRIKTKDQQENPEFFITIFDSGSTTIRANSMNRGSISYSGNLVLP